MSDGPRYEPVLVHSPKEIRPGDVLLEMTAPVVTVVWLDPKLADNHQACVVLADGRTKLLGWDGPYLEVLRVASREPPMSFDPLASVLAPVTRAEALAVLEALDIADADRRQKGERFAPAPRLPARAWHLARRSTPEVHGGRRRGAAVDRQVPQRRG